MRTTGLFFVVLFFFSSVFASNVCLPGAKRPALFVIDMQPFFMKRVGTEKAPENVAKIKQVIASQVEIINEAKKASIAIIFLEYDGYGDTDTLLKEAVTGYQNVKFFKKTAEGMFVNYNKYRKDLINYIQQNQIGHLIMTGANGGSCVLLGIKNALRDNCSVLAYSKGIADFNFKEFVYPYEGKYYDMKPKCEGCTFRETSSLGEVVEIMTKELFDVNLLVSSNK